MRKIPVARRKQLPRWCTITIAVANPRIEA